MSGYGGQVLSKASRRWGRKARQNLRQAWKVLRVNKQQTIYRWQGVSQFDTGTGGFFKLRQKGELAETRDTPLHIYTLTGVRQETGTIAVPAQYMQYTAGGNLYTGNVSFQTLFGQIPQNPGSVLDTWNYEKVENNQSSSTLLYPHQADQLDWVSVKLLLYGSTSQPVKYQIDFVQLTDTWLDPQLGGPNATPDQLTDRNRFWFNMIKQYTYNPILTPQTRDLKALKVLRSYSCTINPTLTTEQTGPGDVIAPHTKELNIFYRMNRTQRYDWIDSSSVPTPNDITLNNAGVEAIVNPNLKNDVHPRAKVFMIIRALSTVGQPAGTDYVPKFNPSYDIVIRKSHSQLSP